jgi:hypothetical protein
MKPAQVQEEEDQDQILEKGIHSMLEEAKGSVQQEELLLLEQGLWGGDEGQAAFSTRQSFAVGFVVATVLTTQTAILHMEWRSCGNHHLAGKSLLPPRSSHLQCQQVNHPAMVDQEEELQEEEEDPQILRLGFIKHGHVRNILERGIVHMGRSAISYMMSRVHLVP